MRLPDPCLLLITDRLQAPTPVGRIVENACAAGCRWVSVREKDLPETEQVAFARSLLPVVRSWGARLMLHGSPALADAAGLDGVHLPAAGDMFSARAWLGTDKLVGISVHGAAAAAELDPALVDYAIAGPAYATPSKPGYGPALDRAGIAAIAAAARVPILAIGGIDPENVAGLLQTGAAGVAVMGSIMRAVDPAERIRSLLASVTNVPSAGRHVCFSA